jgi:hypothetical protein
MIEDYVSDIAARMGIALPQISVINGRDTGSFRIYILNLGTERKQVSTLVHQSELNEIQNGTGCERLELKIRSVLERL